MIYEKGKKIFSLKKYIFIVGNSRSGTTMLSQILGKNDQVFTFNELHFFEQLVDSKKLFSTINSKNSKVLLARLLDIQRRGYLHQRNYVQYLEEANSVIDDVYMKGFRYIDIYQLFLGYETLRNDSEISCEQTPRNLLFIDEILQVFPHAKIINMVRDPRAVLNSQKNKWKLKFLGLKKIPLKESFRAWINYHPVTISKLWSSSIKSGLNYRNTDQVLTLRFEDLLEKPFLEVKNLCDFIGIEYSENMLSISYWGSSREETIENKRGIQKNAKIGWLSGNITEEEIDICQKITHNEMLSLGYPLMNVRPSLIKLGILILYVPIHIIGAILFNLSRTKNIVSSIKMRLR